ncbi:MAG: LLM class F420-dependent oxidoreductase [Acidimicrobiia bacterium]|nr:LLM class F420-dependent oxidoreductase [Acidimicrobiia bacterium]
MQFSIGLPVDHVDKPEEFVTGAAIAEMSAAAEEAGFDAVYVTDHPAPDDRWLDTGGHHALDPLIALAFAAASTTSIRLHTHIYVAAYRNPFLAAKGVATLDALSGGRVILGVAAGYLRPEFGALGVDFDLRNDLLEESIAVMKRVWTEDSVAIEGSGYRARGVTQRPRPAQRPHPPIWIGGNSMRAMRRAVDIGQGWSPFPNPPTVALAVKTPSISNVDELASRLDAAKEYANSVGRTETMDVSFARFESDHDPDDYATIGVTWLTSQLDGHPTRDSWIDGVRELAADLCLGN